jgi:hypothetical protein
MTSIRDVVIIDDESPHDEEDVTWIKRIISSLKQTHPLSIASTMKLLPVSLISLIIEYELSFESIACSLEYHVANLYPSYARHEIESIPIHYYDIPEWLLNDQSSIKRLSRLAFHYWKLAVLFDDYIPIPLLNPSPISLPQTTTTNAKKKKADGMSHGTLMNKSDGSDNKHGSGGSGWSNYRLGMYYLYGLNGCHQINRSIGISLMRMAYHRGIYRSAAVIAHEIGDEWKHRQNSHQQLKHLIQQEAALGGQGEGGDKAESEIIMYDDLYQRFAEHQREVKLMEVDVHTDLMDMEMVEEAVERRDPLTTIWQTLQNNQRQHLYLKNIHDKYREMARTLSSMASPSDPLSMAMMNLPSQSSSSSSSCHATTSFSTKSSSDNGNNKSGKKAVTSPTACVRNGIGDATAMHIYAK